MSLINYGRSDFSNASSLFSTELNANLIMNADDQVLLYCHYIMQRYYRSAKRLYQSYSNWLSAMAKNMSGRIRFIDIGCGPATCGIAFAEQMAGLFPDIHYTGIDISAAMKAMAEKLLGETTGDRMLMDFKTSFMELDDRYWTSVSEVPNLVVFNMSYFFSNVDCTFTENLADRIVSVMRKHPLNRYVFIILHSDHDTKIRSFLVFKSMLEQYVETIKAERSAISHEQEGNPKTPPFCYEIWKSK